MHGTLPEPDGRRDAGPLKIHGSAPPGSTLLPAHMQEVISAAWDYALDPEYSYERLLERLEAAPMTVNHGTASTAVEVSAPSAGYSSHPQAATPTVPEQVPRNEPVPEWMNATQRALTKIRSL
jgi:hypothetical protein